MNTQRPTQFTFLRLLALLLVVAPLQLQAVFANTTQDSPLDTQLLPVGELFSLIIRADAESDPPARISTGTLPDEAVLLRNLDGSRTFMWIPRTEDVGKRTIEVTVTDAKDASISATYPIHFKIVAQLTGDNAQTTESSVSDTLAAEQNQTDAQKPETAEEANVEVEAEVVKKVTEPVDAGTTDISTEATSTVTSESATAPTDTTDTTDASGDDDEAVPPPRLALSNETVTTRVGKPIRVQLEHSDSTGNSANLDALNKPRLAQLLPVKEGHILRWMPTENDVGNHVIILIATDKADSQLQTSRRLVINVER